MLLSRPVRAPVKAHFRPLSRGFTKLTGLGYRGGSPRPKEIIYGSATETDQPFHIKIGWAAHNEVQIGVEANGGASLASILLGVAKESFPEPRSSNEEAEMRDTIFRRLAELGALVNELHQPIDPNLHDPGRLHEHAALGQAIIAALEPDRLGCSGIWATLDRGGCNRMIRNIRKARDSAYGRDE